MLFPELLRILKDFFLELHNLMVEVYHLLVTKFIILFPDLMSSLGIFKKEIALSLDLILEISHFNCLMTDLDFWAVLVRKIPVTVDSW